MNKKLIPLLLAGAALIAGCDKLGQKSENATAPSVNKEDAIAVVNGHYISKATLQTLENEIAERSHGQSFPKEKLIEELIRRELLVQDALHKQLDKSPEMQERFEQAKRSLLSQAALQDFLKSNPVTDEELKAEYEKNVGGENSLEFKARHILVKTEDEAKKLIEELNKGANFEELAKTHSTGPSGPQGGDLGWFIASQMVTPFSEAVIALENGKYTADPVETQFGWHVILREDSRPQTVPPLAAVKEQLLPFLQRQKVQDMLEKLRSQAKIEVLIPIAEEQAAQPAEEGKPAPTAETVSEAAPDSEAPAAEQQPTEATAEAPTQAQ
ncbi:MAG: peptidylprolyl isomerase [Gammaproteobacteria bacterium]